MTNTLRTDGELSVAAPHRHPIRWLVLAGALVVVLPLLVLVGSRLGKDATFVRSPLLGKPAPPFDLPRVDRGGRVRSGDSAGRVVVVNFWASWCVPCREENAALQDFLARRGPQGVDLVGIMYADRRQDALAFRRELGGTWPIAEDGPGRVALDYGVRGVPETFVVDARGVIMAKLIGAVRPGVLDDVLERIRTGGAPVTGRNDQYRRAP